MIKTQRGLPNTCSKCGRKVTAQEGWYAEHDDAARAGLGVCADCAGVPGEAENAAPETPPAEDAQPEPKKRKPKAK